MQDCKAFSMVAVRICRQLMLHVVRLEVFRFTCLDYTVLGKRGSPHNVAPCLHVMRVGKSASEISDKSSHKPFRDIIGRVSVYRKAEVGLHDM